MPLVWILFGTCLLLFPVSAGAEEEPEAGAPGIREQLHAEQERVQAIQARQQEIEKALQQNQSNLKRFEKILQNYRYNLDQAQKVIDAALRETRQIEKRVQEKEDRIARYLQALTPYRLENAFHHPDSRLRYQVTTRAAGRIIQRLFSEIQTSLPRLRELNQIIREKNDLRERILTRYLPADMEKKESQERAVSEADEALEKTQLTADQVQQRVEKLRGEMASADKEIRFRIAERRRLSELSQGRTPPAPAAVPGPASGTEVPEAAPAASAPSTPAPAAPGSPPGGDPAGNRLFEEQKGKMYWPAPGRIVRPFGEFTHPEYQVKMTNNGIDVRTFPGSASAIRSIAPGRVSFSGAISGYGPSVIISHGSDYQSVYGNVKSLVTVEETVQASQIIGEAAGPDYHFEIRRGDTALNPLEWLRPLEGY